MKTKLTLTLFLLLLFFYINGCKKKDENHYIQDSFKEWVLFEKGTYWVYINEDTHVNDSSYIDLNGDNYLFSPTYNNVHYETSRFTIRNSLGSTGTTVVLYADPDADSYLLFEGYLGHIIGYYALIDPSYTLLIDPPKLTALF